MRQPYYAVGFVDDSGHFALDDRAGFQQALQAYKGEEVTLTLQSRSALRSAKANAYYWSVVVQAAVDESGQPDSDIHSYWCELFLPEEKKRLQFFNRLSGERLQVTIDSRRTSKLTGTPFYDYVENCRLWLQEYLGVTTPDPDKDYWRKRTKKAEMVDA